MGSDAKCCSRMMKDLLAKAPRCFMNTAVLIKDDTANGLHIEPKQWRQGLLSGASQTDFLPWEFKVNKRYPSFRVS